MTSGRDRAAGIRAAAGRVADRQRAHARRLLRAAAASGPGRLPGEVTEAFLTWDTLEVRGWACLPGRPPVAVLVTLDERPIGAAELGLATPRDEHGNRRSTRSTHDGWQLVLPREALPIGTLRLGAVAVFADGLTEALLGLPAEHPARRLPAGAIDLPPAGAFISAPTVVVAGWASMERGLDHIDITLGDRPAQRARLMSAPRVDIAALLDEPAAPLAGFHLLLDVPPVDEPSPVVLTAHAVNTSGRVELGARTLTLEPATPRPGVDPDRLAIIAARAHAAATTHRAGQSGVRLLVATHHLGLGGGQLYLQELLRWLLRAEDISCTVLTPADGVLRDELESWGARVHVVGPIPCDGLAYEARMQELCREAVSAGTNIVLANTAGSFWGVDLASRCEVPALWAIHESFTVAQFTAVGFPAPIDDAVEARFLAAFDTAAAVVFEADATRQLFDQVGDPSRYVRVDYGVDLDRIDHYIATTDRDALRLDRQLVPEDVVVLCLGTYEPRKSQGMLALAFSRLVETYPNAVLVLVGDTGSPFAEAVHDVSDRLDLGSRLRLLPVTPDIDAWYRVADGFVLASDIESLPRSMLEAMAFGVPVISSAVYGVPEVLVDGESGLLFEPMSLGSVTAALERFLSMSNHERETIGRRGSELVRGHRQSRFYADSFRALVDGLLRDPRASPSALLGRL